MIPKFSELKPGDSIYYLEPTITHNIKIAKIVDISIRSGYAYIEAVYSDKADSRIVDLALQHYQSEIKNTMKMKLQANADMVFGNHPDGFPTIYSSSSEKLKEWMSKRGV
jgi:hypothetical protein